ncbi:ubiquitin 3 binding protein But2 C-terminal domain-containing protein [Xylogone sp. PMI_703]|nr:ubiquitin 3 binding protein But2 C-terminal domain-containing protein [Xylogone sp. PMI_703]
MHSLVALLAIGGASAVSIPRSGCSFQLNASGGQSGSVGQLSDGQNRIGGGYPQATYTINNGAITDSAGRGCILTPPTKQWQCDSGATPTPGFSIGGSGQLTYSGNTVFYACPASDTEWNIYTTPVAGQQKCVEISLTATGCGSGSSSAPTAPTTTKACASPSLPLPASPPASSSPAGPPPIQTPPASPAPVASSSESTEVLSSPTIPESTPAVPTTTPVEQTASASPPSPSAEGPSTVTVSATTTVTVYSCEQCSCGPQSPQSSAPAVSVPVSPPTTAVTTTPTVPVSTPAVSIPVTTPSVPAPPPQSTPESIPQSAPGSSPGYTPVSTPQSTPGSTPGSTPDSTSGNYQYPHLIVPISSSTPNTAAGTSYFGTISSNTSSIFNFDIPQSYSGKTCSLIFLLPEKSQLETSDYTFSGSGSIDFSQLSSVATQSTTWSNAPNVASDLGTFTITPGSSTLVKSFACPAGTAVSYELSAVGDTYLNYFQDWNPSPIGIYITTC